MSDPEIPAPTPGRRLSTALVWLGVGLAPVAVLVSLLGDSDGSVRLAVLLLAVAVVLIGASVLLRNDAVLLRLDVEDLVVQETDALRKQVRDDIAVAARATHRAFGEKLQVIYDQVSRESGPAVARAAAAATAPVPPGRPTGQAGGWNANGDSTGRQRRAPWTGAPAAATGDPAGGYPAHDGRVAERRTGESAPYRDAAYGPAGPVGDAAYGLAGDGAYGPAGAATYGPVGATGYGPSGEEGYGPAARREARYDADGYGAGASGDGGYGGGRRGGATYRGADRRAPEGGYHSDEPHRRW